MRRLEVQMKMWGVVLKWMTPTKSLYHLVGVSMGMFWVKMYSLFGNRSTLTSTNSSRFDDLRNVLKRTWTRASKSVGLPSWFIFNSSDSSEEINGEQAAIALKEKKMERVTISFTSDLHQSRLVTPIGYGTPEILLAGRWWRGATRNTTDKISNRTALELVFRASIRCTMRLPTRVLFILGKNCPGYLLRAHLFPLKTIATANETENGLLHWLLIIRSNFPSSFNLTLVVRLLKIDRTKLKIDPNWNDLFVSIGLIGMAATQGKPFLNADRSNWLRFHELIIRSLVANPMDFFRKDAAFAWSLLSWSSCFIRGTFSVNLLILWSAEKPPFRDAIEYKYNWKASISSESSEFNEQATSTHLRGQLFVVSKDQGSGRWLVEIKVKFDTRLLRACLNDHTDTRCYAEWIVFLPLSINRNLNSKAYMNVDLPSSVG